MIAALHQKYRPQTLSELVGQPYIQTALTNAINRKQIAPAYLFTGSRGTGKTSTARIFAKSLNCLHTKEPTDEPCGICQSCRSIEVSNSLDVSEIDAASNNGVEDARLLIERSSLAPVQGRYRVFILDEAHCLTNNAFNALLKCLEEPPSRVVFVLCTTESHKVLPTIISRCQVFNFRTLSIQTIESHLRQVADTEDIVITDEALRMIARLSDGGMRDALQLLGQVNLLGSNVTASQVVEMAGGIAEKELLGILNAIASGNTFELLQTARTLIDEGKTPKLIIGSLLQTYRDLLIFKEAPNAEQLLTGVISYHNLRPMGLKWDLNTLNLSLAQLQKAETYLRQTTNGAVWLEVCLLNLVPTLVMDESVQPQPRAKTTLENGNNGKVLTPILVNETQDTEKLDRLWQRLISRAKPNSQKLLAQARLVKLQDSKAILEVVPEYLRKFQANKQTISRMLQRVCGTHQPITLLLKSASSDEQGRERA